MVGNRFRPEKKLKYYLLYWFTCSNNLVFPNKFEKLLSLFQLFYYILIHTIFSTFIFQLALIAFAINTLKL